MTLVAVVVVAAITEPKEVEMKIDKEEIKIVTLFVESDQQMKLPAST